MYVVVALGSRDRSFSVWTTSLKRPFFVINDAFDQGVLDMSWSRDGKIYFLFSHIRCVRLFCFKPTLSPLAYYHFFYTLHTSQESLYKWTKILSLEIDIFGLKMMMKSGLEFFILKFTEPLQSCCCPVQKNLSRKAELAYQVNRYL